MRLSQTILISLLAAFCLFFSSSAVAQSASGIVIDRIIDRAHEQCQTWVEGCAAVDISIDRNSLSQEAPGDGSLPRVTVPDPTGLIIGFNFDTLCSRMVFNKGDYSNICREVINCIMKTGVCTIQDCFNNITNAATDSDMYQNIKQCGVLCSLDPKNNACGYTQCLTQITDKIYLAANGNFSLSGGLFDPVDKHCCTVLTKVFEQDGGEVSSEVDKPGIREWCTFINAGLQCGESALQYADKLDEPGFKLPTNVIATCCQPDLLNFMQEKNVLGENTVKSIRKGCNFSTSVDCAIQIATSIATKQFFDKDQDNGVLAKPLFNACCRSNSLDFMDTVNSLIFKNYHQAAPPPTGGNPDDFPDLTPAEKAKITTEKVKDIFNYGCALTKAFSCVDGLRAAISGTIHAIPGNYDNNNGSGFGNFISTAATGTIGTLGDITEAFLGQSGNLLGNVAQCASNNSSLSNVKGSTQVGPEHADNIVKYCCPSNNPSLLTLFPDDLSDLTTIDDPFDTSPAPAQIQVTKRQLVKLKLDKACSYVQLAKCSTQLGRQIGSAISCTGNDVTVIQRIRSLIPLDGGTVAACCPQESGGGIKVNAMPWPDDLKNVLTQACKWNQGLACADSIVDIFLGGDATKIKKKADPEDTTTPDNTDTEKDEVADAMTTELTNEAGNNAADLQQKMKDKEDKYWAEPAFFDRATCLSSVAPNNMRRPISKIFRMPPSFIANCCAPAMQARAVSSTPGVSNPSVNFFDMIEQTLPGMNTFLEGTCKVARIAECAASIAENTLAYPDVGTSLSDVSDKPTNLDPSGALETDSNNKSTALEVIDRIGCLVPLPDDLRSSCCPGENSGIDIAAIVPPGTADKMSKICNWSTILECGEALAAFAGLSTNAFTPDDAESATTPPTTETALTNKINSINTSTDYSLNPLLPQYVVARCCPNSHISNIGSETVTMPGGQTTPVRRIRDISEAIPDSWVLSLNPSDAIKKVLEQFGIKEYAPASDPGDYKVEDILDGMCRTARTYQCSGALFSHVGKTLTQENKKSVFNKILETAVLPDDIQTACCPGGENGCVVDNYGYQTCTSIEDIAPSFIAKPLKTACGISNLLECASQIVEKTGSSTLWSLPVTPTTGGILNFATANDTPPNFSLKVLNREVVDACCSAVATGIDFMQDNLLTKAADAVTQSGGTPGTIGDPAGTKLDIENVCNTIGDANYCVAEVLNHFKLNHDNGDCKEQCIQEVNDVHKATCENEAYAIAADITFTPTQDVELNFLNGLANDFEAEFIKNHIENCIKEKYEECLVNLGGGCQNIGKWMPPKECCDLANTGAAKIFKDYDFATINGLVGLDDVQFKAAGQTITPPTVSVRSAIQQLCKPLPQFLKKRRACLNAMTRESVPGQANKFRFKVTAECCPLIHDLANLIVGGTGLSGSAASYGFYCYGGVCPSECFAVDGLDGLCKPKVTMSNQQNIPQTCKQSPSADVAECQHCMIDALEPTEDNFKIQDIQIETAAGLVVITLEAGHGLEPNDSIIITDVNGMEELNDNRYQVIVSGDDITLASMQGVLINGSLFTAYIDGGNITPLVMQRRWRKQYYGCDKAGECQAKKCSDANTPSGCPAAESCHYPTINQDIEPYCM